MVKQTDTAAADIDAGAPPANARAIATHMLGQVLRKRRSLDDVWAEQTREGGALTTLEARDRAFARSMVATCLRRLGQIEVILGRFLEKPLPKEAAREHDLLRLGVAQLVFMDMAPHAVVDEAVGLASSDRFRGLINAVLRRVAEQGKAIAAAQDAARINTPDWLWDSWITAYGQSAARGIAEQHLNEPTLDIWAPKERETWAERLEAEELPTGTLRRPLADVRNLIGYRHGAWWVQDVASSLPARLFAEPQGQTIFDLCAAPGGKTVQLASMGAKVVAMDRSPKRLERVKENLDRLHLQARLQEQDAGTWKPAIRPMAILLDAPCTATGTIRRHPDIAHLKTPEEVAAMAQVQERLLANAFANLAPGGTLIFCTCSLQPEEGLDRVEALLEREPTARRMAIDPAEIDDFEEAVSRDGDLRTLPCIWPEHGGMDGFYAARLQKTADA